MTGARGHKPGESCGTDFVGADSDVRRGFVPWSQLMDERRNILSVPPIGKIERGKDRRGFRGYLLALDEIADEVGHLGAGDKKAVRRCLVSEQLLSECEGDLNNESSDSFQQYDYYGHL